MSDIFVLFEPNLEFVDRFLPKSPISTVTEIRPVGTALIHTDRHEEIIRALVTYENAPKSETIMNLVFTDFVIKNMCLWNP